MQKERSYELKVMLSMLHVHVEYPMQFVIHSMVEVNREICAKEVHSRKASLFL